MNHKNLAYIIML